MHMYLPGYCDVAYVTFLAARELTGCNDFDTIDWVYFFDEEVDYFDFPIHLN